MGGRVADRPRSELHVTAGWIAPIMLEHDVHHIDVIFAAEDDGIVSPSRRQGVGEIGIVASPP